MLRTDLILDCRAWVRWAGLRRCGLVRITWRLRLTGSGWRRWLRFGLLDRRRLAAGIRVLIICGRRIRCVRSVGRLWCRRLT